MGSLLEVVRGSLFFSQNLLLPFFGLERGSQIRSGYKGKCRSRQCSGSSGTKVGTLMMMMMISWTINITFVCVCVCVFRAWRKIHVALILQDLYTDILKKQRYSAAIP